MSPGHTEEAPPMNHQDMRSMLKSAVAPEQAALVVIDVQNDFCAVGGYYDKTGADISAAQPAIDRLVTFIGQARGAGVRVIFVRCDYDPVYVSETQNARRWRMGWDMPYCRPGTWGAEFFKVAPRPGELIVTKHRYDAFYNTDLELILRTNKVQGLLFTGVATNVCVESSLRSAYMRDFAAVLVSDCCAARNARAHEATIDNVRAFLGQVATADEVAQLWSETRMRAVGAAAS
jgi:ureidoacrylate peracid hydrolase